MSKNRIRFDPDSGLYSYTLAVSVSLSCLEGCSGCLERADIGMIVESAHQILTSLLPSARDGDKSLPGNIVTLKTLLGNGSNCHESDHARKTIAMQYELPMGDFTSDDLMKSVEEALKNLNALIRTARPIPVRFYHQDSAGLQTETIYAFQECQIV